jgi:ABC-type transporter Mla MlaB component
VEPATVRIDLAELGFVDVRGLVTLDEFAADLSGTGRRLVLTNAEPVLRRGAELLELGHLTEALEVR